MHVIVLGWPSKVPLPSSFQLNRLRVFRLGAEVEQTNLGKREGAVDKLESSQPRGKAKNV